MRGSATEPYWDEFSREILSRAKLVKVLSKETQSRFVPLQEIFQKACESHPEARWTRDGIHPTPGGHQLIANAWIQAFHSFVVTGGKEHESCLPWRFNYRRRS